MPATIWRFTSCHNCRICLSGGRVHGPHAEYWEQAGKNHRIHRYGGGSDGMSAPASSLSPPPDMDSEAVSESVIRYVTLPAEKQEEIAGVITAKGRAKRLRAKSRQAMDEAVEGFLEERGRLPDEGEYADISERVRASYGKELDAAERESEKRSGRLTRWRQKERERRVRDEERYEIERERYEAAALREMADHDRGKLYAVVMELGGVKTNDALREEYREIPNTYKRRDGMSGDDMADHLARMYPEFGIRDERDLVDFFSGAAA